MDQEMRKQVYYLWLTVGKPLYENGTLMSLHAFGRMFLNYPADITNELFGAIVSGDFSCYDDVRPEVFSRVVVYYNQDNYFTKKAGDE